MARFEIQQLEGTQYVDAHLNHEMVRLEAGALSYLQGDIKVHSALIPSLGGAFKSMIADEAVYRPTYSGTGIITLESSLGGSTCSSSRGESWILERGAYWASEGSVDVGFHREKILPSLWAGRAPSTSRPGSRARKGRRDHPWPVRKSRSRERAAGGRRRARR